MLPWVKVVAIPGQVYAVPAPSHVHEVHILDVGTVRAAKLDGDLLLQALVDLNQLFDIALGLGQLAPELVVFIAKHVGLVLKHFLSGGHAELKPGCVDVHWAPVAILFAYTVFGFA